MRKDDQEKQRMHEHAIVKPITLDAKQRKQNKYKSSSRALGDRVHVQQLQTQLRECFCPCGDGLNGPIGSNIENLVPSLWSCLENIRFGCVGGGVPLGVPPT